MDILSYMNDKAKARFFAKVDTRGGCWLWTGAKFTNFGYGAFKLGGKAVPAHRVAYAIYHDKNPELLVMHICDNPSCVKDEHLKEGTAKENAQDCVAKGRKNNWKIRGERNGNSKLKDADVRLMREMRNDGKSGYELAKTFACTPQAVYLILSGQRRAYPTPGVVEAYESWYNTGDDN